MPGETAAAAILLVLRDRRAQFRNRARKSISSSGWQAHMKSTPAPHTSVSWPRRLVWRGVAALAGGLILRLWMFKAFPQGQGDALIYGNFAKNLLLHGQFAITDGSGVFHPSLIRLPGYPLFLAACFRIFGLEHYNAIGYLQTVLELGACLLLADFVRRISTPRAGLNTLWLASMCPFTAVYASAPLTESLTFDMICLALWSLQRVVSARTPENQLPASQFSKGAEWPFLGLFTLAISSAAMLRPDGALLAFALWPALILSRNRDLPISRALRSALLCGLLSILPFAVWAGRNWIAFHVFEPLAPRYANDPGENPHLGWQHWVKTWCVDFACTEEVYWNVPDDVVDFNNLPPRAFDSPEQKQQTTRLIADYNQVQDLTPDLDARFEALARQRAAEHPLRNFVLLPLSRLADMTFRPRVENLTIDLHWWEYNHHRAETRFSWVYAGVNALFLLLGVVGLCYRPRLWGYMVAYIVLRSLLLLTIEAPETRYTLEFFPMFFAAGGIALQRIFSRNHAANPAPVIG